jgi:hypothetical protein
LLFGVWFLAKFLNTKSLRHLVENAFNLKPMEIRNKKLKTRNKEMKLILFGMPNLLNLFNLLNLLNLTNLSNKNTPPYTGT